MVCHVTLQAHRHTSDNPHASPIRQTGGVGISPSDGVEARRRRDSGVALEPQEFAPVLVVEPQEDCRCFLQPVAFAGTQCFLHARHHALEGPSLDCTLPDLGDEMFRLGVVCGCGP